MALLLGDTGKVAVGSLKTIKTIMATPREDNIDVTPVNFSTDLPTIQTSTVGATFTVQASDLPTIQGTSVKYTAFLIVSGKNTTAGSINVSSQGFKNGTSVATSTTLSTPANNYWAHTYYRFYDVVPGDILNVQVWAGATGVSYDYCALIIFPSRYQCSKEGVILKDITFTDFQAAPLSLAPASSGGTLGGGLNNQAYNVYVNISNTVVAGTTGTVLYPAIGFTSNFGLLRSNNGDAALNSYTNANSTNRNYARLAVPLTITFREILR
jgi:hypothetical protein